MAPPQANSQQSAFPQTSSSRKRTKRDEKIERSKKRKLERTKTTAALTAAPHNTATPDDNASEWSKSKKKRMRANKAKIVKRNDNGASREHGGGEAAVDVATRTQQRSPMATSKNDQRDNSLHADSIANTMTKQPLTTASSTLSKYQARLQGSRFRVLNEQLYTMHSKQAYAQFSTNPQLFQDYHAGFASQVEHWPVQPVVVVADELKRLVVDVAGGGETASKNNSRGAFRKQFPIVIADFGCGKAELAQDLLKFKSSSSKDAAAACPFQVHSFDLVASSSLVTPCDMSKTPLDVGIVDVAVFCLSLMGNNLADFIREAHRVLKPSGIVKIVEVRSRFETTGDESGAAPDARSKKGKPGRNHNNENTAPPPKPISELKRFLNALDQLGFECVNLDRSNKMFFVLDLRKNGKHPDMSLEFTAKPCIYKRR
ncbi:hypothetical protein MPSEU_000402000 [Mayamaea pseudoterrestris]|nr:hypothetical protein MPSEU_000402000 [Mayamaea pseudoterrestris]